MDIRKLQRAIVDGLEDVKAQHIVVFNTEHLSPLFERVIIATGTSNRQTKALASSVREAVKGAGLPVLSTEGSDNGEWIIVDCGAAVAHIMQPGIRDYYRLEEIWGGKPVRMKFASEAPQGLPKASAPDEGARPASLATGHAASGRKAAPARKAGGARKAGSAKHTAQARQPAPTRKAAPSTKAALGRQAAPARKTGATRSAGPAKGAGAQRPAKPSRKPASGGRAGGSPARKSGAHR